MMSGAGHNESGVDGASSVGLLVRSVFDGISAVLRSSDIQSTFDWGALAVALGVMVIGDSASGRATAPAGTRSRRLFSLTFAGGGAELLQLE